MDKFTKTARQNRPAQQPTTRTSKRLREARLTRDAEHLEQLERAKERRALRKPDDDTKI